MKSRRHIKIPGFVEEIGQPWAARILVDGLEYEAETNEPLPPHAVEGSYFTLHRTRHGRIYFYWITRPRMTKRRLKRSRIWARKIYLNTLGGQIGN